MQIWVTMPWPRHMDSGYLECHGSTVGEDTFIVSEKSHVNSFTKHNGGHISGWVIGSRENPPTGFRHYLIITCNISVLQSWSSQGATGLQIFNTDVTFIGRQMLQSKQYILESFMTHLLSWLWGEYVYIYTFCCISLCFSFLRSLFVLMDMG